MDAKRHNSLAGLQELGRPVTLTVAALVLDNFKSFKKKTRIPLRDGFTTVSGPNGSGKSNIIDAMQFVMGTATSKGMRAERLTDLICNDGGKNTARVTLELDGTFRRHDQTLLQRRVEITRVVRRSRSGTNAHYELDGEGIRLVDLHDLLRQLGFPTSGQNIVMQGDVIRVTSMGGTARRQILDELAGAKEFDKRIGQANNELESADRCTEDTKLIVKELAGRLGQLKKERDAALNFQSLTSRKASLQEDLLVLDVTEAEVNVLNKEAEEVQTAKAIKTQEKDRERLRKASAEKQAELKAVETELSSKGEGERMTAVRAVESLKTRIESERERAGQTQADHQALEAKLPQLQAEVGQAETKLQGIDAQLEQLNAVVAEKEGKHQTLVGKCQGISETLRAQSAAQIEAAQRGQEQRLVVEETRNRERELITRDRVLAEQISRKQAEKNHLEEAIAEGTVRLEALREQSKHTTERFRTQRQALSDAQERRRALHQRVLSLRSGMETTASKVGRAEQDLAAAEARRAQAMLLSGGKALAYLKHNKLKGLHGPVSDLVKFEAKYASALEAAAGGRLRWVVVDNENVAKRGIELLKRGNVGRLSFAPLTKMRPPKLDGNAPRGKAIVGYALDLVSSDRKYMDVLTQVFSNTLVVESLQDALPLIGRYRMVTLDGDILERHGLMTGGARTRGGQLLLATAKADEEIEQRKKALFELEKQSGAARGAMRQVEKEYEQVSESLGKLQAEYAEAEAKSASVNAELKRLEDTLAPQTARIEALTAELEALLAERAEVTQQLEALGAQLSGDAPLLDGDVEAAGKRFEALTQQAKQYENEMRTLEKELAGLRQQQTELTGERRAIEARLEAARKAVVEAQAQLLSLATKVGEVEAQVEAFKAQLAEREAALQELSGELLALTKRRDEARDAAETARDAVREADHTVAGLNERLQAIAVELEELRATAVELRASAEEAEIEVPPPEEAPPDLAASRKKLEGVLAKIEGELETMGPVNQLAIEQYDEASERHGELEAKIESLETEKDEIRARMVNLEGKKKTAFLDSFALVSEAFQHTFNELARGEGRLRLENPKDPFSGGLIIEARPRGKKLSRLEVMSGGEKTLTALAFIFALQEVNPAPFFVFDEVDAALDGVNTEVVGEAIKRRGGDRQYLMISHHRVCLEKSDQTIGVTMRRGFGTQVTGVSYEAETREMAEAV
jgi:chromosome segregation protein